MGEIKEKIRRLTEGKKLRKDQCLVLVLIGMLLCVISLPTEKETTKSHLWDTADAKIENEQTFESEEAGGESGSYAARWEEKLEESLREVEGAGQVRVLITLAGSEEQILTRDGREEVSDTIEKDAAGGSRHVSETIMDKSVVRTVDERGEEVPLVVRTIAPEVEGVVVIAQGAGSAQVRRDIIEAIQVLFEIDMNRIAIIKMKTNNQ
ncbi:MAG: hypothetical protein NC302_05595 [Bacteroidales bacterium]|nr:hypothetical protein [Bacteroidales bacterium]MCM1415484.1 hypothetical protein [bacterium]MCM1423421.1 hypothetical protein [bacterium]